MLVHTTARTTMLRQKVGSHVWRTANAPYKFPSQLNKLRQLRGVCTSHVAMAKKGGKKEDDGPYSATVKLPVTDFSLRANAVVREPEIQKFWTESKVYESLVEENPGETYTLHDGPPYANGDLHIGHALNKILKDIINRYQLLRGRKARFVPGWDTHGLPIELKVLQGMSESERRELDVLGLRRKARDFALKTVNSQREQFKRFGVWADWDSPYVTLQPAYEAAQLGVFAAMVLNGHIYRGRKPVHWSPSSRTALAEAELEYPEGHTSRSVYVAMPCKEVGPEVPAEMAGLLQGAAFAIWTTTPWTLPANLAVAVNEQLPYAVVEAQGEAAEGWSHRRLVVAEGLVDTLSAKLGVELKVVSALSGSQLAGCSYTHPLFDRVSPVVVGGDYITTESGTGLVHTAPGHGQEDYQVGLRCGLPLLSPVDDAGLFTEEAGERFKGLNVLGDGNSAVVAALSESRALLLEEKYAHKYPYDWRTKKPTIFRATDQWFASVEGFRSAAMDAIGQVTWVPASGAKRIGSMTSGRSDWCISRQRKWGVPIPVFYDIDSGEPLMTAETMAHVQSIVAEKGSDAWWELDVADLLPPSQRHLAPRLRRGEDTMDVWFDSGSSWAGVLRARGGGLAFPADLYLEGSDQHRGWFQSSLLTAVAATGAAPYRSVLTHGFVLDEKGVKMSKSLGNVVDPLRVIAGGKDQKKEPPYGADVLRLWVASVDYTSDVMIGGMILKQIAEAYRKLRNTLRFLLGNLHAFDPDTHCIPLASLPATDRYVLHRLAQLTKEVQGAYDSYQFFKVYQSVQRFVVVELSSFYLDVAKDRLYIRAESDPSRRACQTVLSALLRGLLAALAPLAPHMVEDAWLNLPHARPAASVFQAGWPHPPPEWDSLSAEDVSTWEALLRVRDAANVALELARGGKLLGASLEAKLHVFVADEALRQRLRALDSSANGADELRYLFIVSQVELVDTAEAAGGPHVAEVGAGEGRVAVSRAAGCKCARCWNYSLAVLPDSLASLCERCGPVVAALGGPAAEAAAAAAAAAATGKVGEEALATA